MSQHGQSTGKWAAFGGGTSAPSPQGKHPLPGDQQQRPGRGSNPPTTSSLANRLAQRFPEVAARIDESDFGILHLEVGALKLATQDAITAGDWHAVTKYFAFVAGLIEDAGDELRDAINVSYLGNLFYGEMSANYAKARTLLPKPLARALEQIENHFEDLVR